MVFSYIFLLFDCFEWVLIDCIEKRRVHSDLWQFQMGRGIIISFPYIFLLVDCFKLAVSNGGVHLPLVSTCFLYALVFPYIFLLFDCFEWALIDHIEKRRGHSVLWQFQMGRGEGGQSADLP